MKIHPMAIVEPTAEIADDVEIGPYSYIGPLVKIGPACRVLSHAVVDGKTVIGAECAIHQGAVIGGPPQDLKHDGEPTELVVGDRNTFREFVTVNTGTVHGGGRTTIGSDCMLMAYVHVAHDCVLGDNIVIANATGLGGHILIESGARLSGLVAIHHFATVGALAFISGCAKVVRDVPPYMVVDGNPAKIRGLNLEGLRRSGMTRESIDALKEAYRFLYRSSLNRRQALEEIERMGAMSLPEIQKLAKFFHDSALGKRGRGREALRHDSSGGDAEEETANGD